MMTVLIPPLAHDVLQPAPSTASPAEAPPSGAQWRAVIQPEGPTPPAAAPDPLAARRDALRARYRWALTPEEAVVHRRLLGAGRIAEARALLTQAEGVFRTARQLLPAMNADELSAFEGAVERDDGPQRCRVLATVLRRLAREDAFREAPVLTTEIDPD